jgi:hypothetical protein
MIGKEPTPNLQDYLASLTVGDRVAVQCRRNIEYQTVQRLTATHVICGPVTRYSRVSGRLLGGSKSTVFPPTILHPAAATKFQAYDALWVHQDVARNVLLAALRRRMDDATTAEGALLQQMLDAEVGDAWHYGRNVRLFNSDSHESRWIACSMALPNICAALRKTAAEDAGDFDPLAMSDDVCYPVRFSTVDGAPFATCGTWTHNLRHLEETAPV